jgi:hypothetical protein
LPKTKIKEKNLGFEGKIHYFNLGHNITSALKEQRGTGRTEKRWERQQEPVSTFSSIV